MVQQYLLDPVLLWMFAVLSAGFRAAACYFSWDELDSRSMKTDQEALALFLLRWFSLPLTQNSVLIRHCAVGRSRLYSPHMCLKIKREVCCKCWTQLTLWWRSKGFNLTSSLREGESHGEKRRETNQSALSVPPHWWIIKQFNYKFYATSSWLKVLPEWR